MDTSVVDEVGSAHIPCQVRLSGADRGQLSTGLYWRELPDPRLPPTLSDWSTWSSNLCSPPARWAVLQVHLPLGSLWGCWASWAPTCSPLLFWGALPHQPSALTSPQRLFSRGPGLRQRVTSWLSVSFSFLMFHKMKVWLTTDGVLDSLKLAGSQPSSRVGEVEKQAAGEDRVSKGPGHPAAKMILSWRKVTWADLVLERCGWLRGD